MGKYDHIIIGAGPTGLTVAWILSQYNKKILIIEREDDIGGVHRVKRINKYFTEHSPRVYSNSYVNFKMILKDMCLNFYELFTPYNFNLTDIGGKSIYNFKIYELYWFIVEFLKTNISNYYSKSISCLDFMNEHKFTCKTKDYIDRVCRLTDGVGSDKYTLFQLFQTINQHAFYDFFQPNKPNDNGLFKTIKDKLTETNNISFVLNAKVTHLNSSNNKISNIIVEHNNKYMKYVSDSYIFAIPPSSLIEIFNNSNDHIKNSFMEYDKLIKWNKKNRYNTYIPITFHWEEKLNLPKIHGFPGSSWGLVFNVLTDYFKLEESNTAISVCLSITDVKSPLTGKNANESNEHELIKEAFRQLKLSFANLPNPTKSIISHDLHKVDGKWYTNDKAYMMTNDIVKFKFPFKSIKFDNLYSVGVHNGESLYHFNTYESAVSNGIMLCRKILPQIKNKYYIKEPLSLMFAINIIILIIISIVLFFTFFSN